MWKLAASCQRRDAPFSGESKNFASLRSRKPPRIVSYPIESALLQPGRFWHLRQRAFDDRIFYQPDDYRDFLRRLHERSRGLFRVYGYALLPDHYHLLLKTHDQAQLLATWAATGKPPSRAILRNLPVVPSSADQPDFAYLRGLPAYVRDMACAQFVSRQLGTMLSSYALRVNGREYREEALFRRPFHRREVPAEHLPALLVHLHRNSRHHRLQSDFAHYPHTSYRAYLSEKPTALPRAEVLERFGGKAAFEKAHQRIPPNREAWRKFALE